MTILLIGQLISVLAAWVCIGLAIFGVGAPNTFIAALGLLVLYHSLNSFRQRREDRLYPGEFDND